MCFRAASAGVARGFTLLELITIIAIIVLLLGILAPSLQHVYRLAMRVKCASNMHQWHVALSGYAADNDFYFPENISGSAAHISWCSETVGQFWEDYLLKWDKDHIQRGYDVLACPTQEWHRHESALGNLFGLCGYFYMPHRDNTPWNTMDYTPAGKDWVTKKRFGENPDTPIMADMKQAWVPPAPGWYLSDGTPISSHRQSTGEPYGGNYLFENGDIQWYDTAEIGLGGTVGAWRFYYKIPTAPP